MATQYIVPGFPFSNWITETGTTNEVVPGNFIKETTLTGPSVGSQFVYRRLRNYLRR